MASLKQLEMFIAVVEEGNFTKAADRLNLTSMAVSKQISALENILDLTLLERSTRQVRVTDTGNTIYQKAKNILDNHNELIDFAETLHESPQGLLHIACTVSTAYHFLIPRLPEFTRMHPQVQFEINLLDKHSDFDIEKYDIMLGIPMDGFFDANQDLVSVPLFTARRLLCAAPAYLKKFGKPNQIQDLTKHHYIAHSGRIEDPVVERCREKTVNLQTTTVINSTHAMAQCCLLGMGLGLIADFIIKHDIQAGRLIALTDVYQEQATAIHMLYRQPRYLQPKVHCFKEFMRET